MNVFFNADDTIWALYNMDLSNLATPENLEKLAGTDLLSYKICGEIRKFDNNNLTQDIFDTLIKSNKHVRQIGTFLDDVCTYQKMTNNKDDSTPELIKINKNILNYIINNLDTSSQYCQSFNKYMTAKTELSTEARLLFLITSKENRLKVLESFPKLDKDTIEFVNGICTTMGENICPETFEKLLKVRKIIIDWKEKIDQPAIESLLEKLKDPFWWSDLVPPREQIQSKSDDKLT